jgi:hypothetical protein
MTRRLPKLFISALIEKLPRMPFTFRHLNALCFFFILCAQQHTLTAQDRCGTVAYAEKLRNEKKNLQRDDSFETWIKKKIQSRNAAKSQGRTQETTYKIPVVVHVIHNGEPIGSGLNISDAQILSQIDVLNKDFQRLNADASKTPAEFLPLAGTMDIEFVLAKRSPQGLFTNGIVRVQGTKTSWTQNDNDQLKAQSYWPAEDYLNIWVCKLTDFLGYTQFPVSNLPGLENSSTNRLTDGIVIRTATFGSKNYGNFNLEARYDLGRTLTHEMGHFFGLRHIWGDMGNCAGDDYVADTPNQNGSTGGCPSTEKAGCDLNVHKMYQNYLDYTDDACMNLFTKDQVDRMIAVLENSPRRLSLLSSLGWKEPDRVPNDLGIANIVTPQTSVCSSTIQPSLEIKNFGNNTITSAQIQLKINSLIAETKTFDLNLGVSASAVIDFSPQVLSEGLYDFNFEILKTNGVADGVYGNDTLNVEVLVQIPIVIPFSEDFNSLDNNWAIKNPDQVYTWDITPATSNEPNNNALYLNFYNYEDRLGEQDFLYSPVFDLSNETIAFLTFDVAYARYQASSNDGLKVLALTDCNNNLFTATEIYSKSGGALATSANTKQPFVPTSQNQWRKEVINLSQFIGKSNVQLVFIGTNDWGNNLYLDNVAVVDEDSFLDISLNRINNPALVSCKTPEPKLLVQNQGTKTISSLKVKYNINGGNYITSTFSSLNLSPGGEQEITLSPINLTEGNNVINFIVFEPNDEPDINASNDALTINTMVNSTVEVIPMRENFNSAEFNQVWTLVNPKAGANWESVQTNFDNSLYFNGFSNTTIDDEAWLVSPLLDFSNTDKASVFFNHSYAHNENRSTDEALLVLGAIGCGNPFNLVLYDNSNNLSNTNSTVSWAPAEASDWVKDYVNLTSLAGQKDVRLAWVVTNGNGNNLYLDNIEFFASEENNPPQISELFRIYGNGDLPGDFAITFNLAEQQTVIVDVFDTMGRTLVSDTRHYVLNQTFPITLEGANAGVYIVRVRTATQTKVRKIYVGN